jgi:hypothetical protein
VGPQPRRFCWRLYRCLPFDTLHGHTEMITSSSFSLQTSSVALIIVPLSHKLTHSFIPSLYFTIGVDTTHNKFLFWRSFRHEWFVIILKLIIKLCL